MFDKAFEIVVGLEGGYVNHPLDPGGETKFGISKRAYPHLNIKTLTLEKAKSIYKKDYWDAAECSLLEPALALLYFDFAVNSGVGAARQMLKEAPTYEQFIAGRMKFYTDLPTFRTFGLGWIRRLEHIISEGLKLRRRSNLDVLVVDGKATRKPFLASVDNKPLVGRKLEVKFV
jgi:lysozyme family protein